MIPAARLFKALADTNRLRIVNLLSRTSLCVSDLQRVLGLAQPLISRHLAHLRNAGLVQDRRDGPRVCYSLTLEGPFGEVLRSFLGEVLPSFENFQKDHEKLVECEGKGELASCASPGDGTCDLQSTSGCAGSHPGLPKGATNSQRHFDAFLPRVTGKEPDGFLLCSQVSREEQRMSR